MNRMFLRMRKLFLTGLCICLFTASTFYMSCSALAGLPPGEYDNLGTPAPVTSDYGYSPYSGGREFPQQVFWGDTHLHTVLSFDAGAGGTRLTPEDSFLFARGEEVYNEIGQKIKLSRPLDFLVVSDHSDYLGGIQQIITGEPPEILEDPKVNEWHEGVNSDDPDVVADTMIDLTKTFAEGEMPETIYPQSDEEFRTAWQQAGDSNTALDGLRQGVFRRRVVCRSQGRRSNGL
ncbi:MAG: DUF3604 domain-containing protein [Okeania sp. SIO2C2]|uniref:DUF3604 domain-containing protein n=1 Tax=Okeania sp. SIO2C2 TaxID=2607787 RepID=UPI0013B7F80E|nr:DUF3604 domain-containing protein [Okeania sp. SIO2C2]NEP85916.1 DUF3604 domain-containing protein [Okeania sp. SIO2C2]